MPELAGRERTAPGLVHRVAAELGAVAVFERSEGVQEGAPVGRHGALTVEAEQCQAVSASAASAVLVPAAAALLYATSLLATAVCPSPGCPPPLWPPPPACRPPPPCCGPPPRLSSERFQDPISPSARRLDRPPGLHRVLRRVPRLLLGIGGLRRGGGLRNATVVAPGALVG